MTTPKGNIKMAYDANDPKDKAIVQGLIDAALEEQQSEHETEIQGLKDKRDELLAKLKKARTGEGSENTAEIERLEDQLSDAQSELRKAQTEVRQLNRQLETVTGERDTAVSERDSEREISRTEFVNNRLTSELAGANVASHFIDDLVSSMGSQVTVKEVEGKREPFVGDKSLGDYIKEWSQGDKGKHYVKAPGNGGGGATNSNNSPQGGDKKIWQMTQTERLEAYNADPKGFDARVAAGEANKPVDA